MESETERLLQASNYSSTILKEDRNNLPEVKLNYKITDHQKKRLPINLSQEV